MGDMKTYEFTGFFSTSGDRLGPLSTATIRATTLDQALRKLSKEYKRSVIKKVELSYFIDSFDIVNMHIPKSLAGKIAAEECYDAINEKLNGKGWRLAFSKKHRITNAHLEKMHETLEKKRISKLRRKKCSRKSKSGGTRSN